MTDKIDISPEAVAAMLNGVTPGPWAVEYKCGTTRLMMGDDCQMCDETYYPWVPSNYKDWHFIAWAREAVPALSARLAEAEGRAYTLAVAIMGGEDAPGYADSIDALTLAEQLGRERIDNNAWVDACVKVERDRAEAAEAKLAKAVEALEEIATDEHPIGWVAIAALAELKGTSDE